MHEIVEERVLINSDIKIGATITRLNTEGKKPLVLLIMGTGKTDRDGNQFGLKSNLYKDLAQMFANFGYVCVRYDKRGTHESTGKFLENGLYGLVEDAKSVIEYAKNLSYVDETKIIACGHSEGAMIATLLTKQTKLDRIILLGGAGICLKSAMMYQNHKVVEEFNSKKGLLGWYVRKVINEKKAQAQVNSLFDKAVKAKKDKFFFRGVFMPTKWLQEHGSFTDEDFVKMIENYDGKVLALTGKKDLQAEATCLENLKGFAHVLTSSPEKLNHMLRDIPENDANSILNVKKQYKKLLKEPISESLVNEIQEFLQN